MKARAPQETANEQAVRKLYSRAEAALASGTLVYPYAKAKRRI